MFATAAGWRGDGGGGHTGEPPRAGARPQARVHTKTRAQTVHEAVCTSRHTDTCTHTHTHTHTHTQLPLNSGTVSGALFPGSRKQGSDLEQAVRSPGTDPVAAMRPHPKWLFQPPRSPWFSKTLNPSEAA